ncbi:hypothetical protein V8D89_001990 [Ganoderma adspersum]
MTIDTLPVELLLSIFEHVQEDETKPGDPTRSHSPHWRVIRQVCKHWHDIADDHPRLWRIIDVLPSKHALDWVNLCLSKSGTAELELHFHSPHAMLEACNALIAHAGRIRTIWAAGEETIRGLHALRPLFLLNLPKVQELHLDDNFSHLTRPIYDRDTRFVLTELLGDLSTARLPALHTVALRGIFLPWESPILRQLRVLRLACWEENQMVLTANDAYNLPSDWFLYALAGCSRLEELSLNVTNTDPHIRLAMGGLPTIVLPRLRRLALEINQLEARVLFVPLLAHIRVPAACNVVLDGATHMFDLSPPAYADFLPPPLPDGAPQCFPALANAVEATWHGPTAFSCKAAPALPPLRLALRDGREEHRRAPLDPEAALAQFCSYVAHAPRLTTLTLRTSVSEAAYAHAFRALTGVTELVVEYPRAPRREDVRGLLSALAGESGSEVVGPGEGPGVLPGLRVLRLRGPVRYDGLDGDVAECLRRRREAGVRDVGVEVDAEG